MINSSTLLAMRNARKQVSFLQPTELPGDVDAAYRVADDLATAQGGHVTAWKLGATTPGTRRAFATEQVYYGALLDTEVLQQPNTVTATPLPFRGEAEIALRIANDLTPQQAAEIADAAALFDAFAPAIECPWSVVANLPEAGLPALLMDRCAAGLLLLGAPRPLDITALDGRLEIYVDNVVVASGQANRDMVMSPITAACAAIRVIGQNGGRLVAGQWISTGGISACVVLPINQPFSLHFAGTQELCVKAVAA